MDDKFVIARFDENDEDEIVTESKNAKKKDVHSQNDKSKEDVDRYSKERIPSYLRKEDVGGITSSNIDALKGVKKDPEEEKENNRRIFGNNYNLIYDNYYKKEKSSSDNNESLEDEYFEEIVVDEDSGMDNDYYGNYEEIKNTDESYNYVNTDDEENFFSAKKEEEQTSKAKLKSFHDKPIEQENVEKNDFCNNSPKALNNNVEEKKVYDVPKQYNKKEHTYKKFEYPPLSLLNRSEKNSTKADENINRKISIINKVLNDFNVPGSVSGFVKGPALTLYEVKLEPGVNVKRVTSIAQNLEMELCSGDIFIRSPLPGKAAIGIEVPNKEQELVLFGDLLANEIEEAKRKGLPRNQNEPLNTIVGLTIDGNLYTENIYNMPHGLIAGATGSGKTACVDSLICSLIFKNSPDDVRLVLVDPKGNEFAFFEDVPHLACPVIYDKVLAPAALKWCADEMDRRYEFLKIYRKRVVKDYNEYAKMNGLKTIPYIVIIIDEFAEIISQSTVLFEDSVKRLTAKARGAGIHLIVATQRPSADIVKGSIKANITHRIALKVKTNVDSTTILDHGGAEKLLGKGDMIVSTDKSELRIQGSYISDKELERIYDYFAEKDYPHNYLFTHEDIVNDIETKEQEENSNESDPYVEEIARFVFRQRKASANQIQKTFNIGYNRADKIINILANIGIISKENIPGRARNVIIEDIDELEEILKNSILKVE